jgi:uncharacterized short protein YbdD (DUF466 family)
MGTRLNLLDATRSLWRSIRELSGDDGYERYVAHHTAAHPESAPRSRTDWFAYEQQQKWTGVKRCC